MKQKAKILEEDGPRKGQPISYQNEERDAWLLVINLQRAFYMAQFEGGQLSSAAFEVLEDFMAKTTAIAGSVPVSELRENLSSSTWVRRPISDGTSPVKKWLISSTYSNPLVPSHNPAFSPVSEHTSGAYAAVTRSATKVRRM